MYLLTACTVSWLCLIGAFITTWIQLPMPRSTTDLVVIIVVSAAAVLSSRLGVVSLLTLLIRLLPNGRMRTIATQYVLRIVPTILRSSVLAAASASLAVSAAQASPPPADTHVSEAPAASPESASATLDPGWPTAVPDDPPPDPGWPTVPPRDEPESPAAEPESPVAEPDLPDDVPAPPPPRDRPPNGAGSPPGHKDGDESIGEDSEIHVVGVGESLWSIAVDHASSASTAQDIVDDIYSANREVIGANPNLIMPGQRLEIQS